MHLIPPKQVIVFQSADIDGKNFDSLQMAYHLNLNAKYKN